MTAPDPTGSGTSPRRLVRTKTMVLETNHACNLRCIHCYVPGDSKQRVGFVDHDLAESLFDQFEANGFQYLLLTGGEPLAHPHFEDLYTSAWDRGFSVSLFTNGLLLDDERLDLLTRKPPAVVRISLFGGSRQSYAEVAGRDGFERALDRIGRLHERGLPVRVRLPLLRQNRHDVARAHASLRRRGIPAKIEVRIIPRFNQDREVLAWRLTPEEIASLGLESPAANLEKFRQLRQQQPRGVRTLRWCLERCQPFVINPEGRLQLCFFLRDHSVDLHTTPLADAIRELVEVMLTTEVDGTSERCRECSLQTFCGYCPGWARNEVGRAGEPIPFLCRTAELFWNKYEEIEAAAVGAET